jgi:uncharacterized protein
VNVFRGATALKACLVTALTLSVAGCAGYSQQTTAVVAASKSGNMDQALANLESKNTSSDKDILYYFEKGELLRQKGSYEDARLSWLAADEKIRGWEDDVRFNPSKLLGDLGSVLINDTTRRYDGRDYEKVFLSVRLAQTHIALGDWQATRTEIRKMHEREAIIAEYRAKEMDKAEAESEKKGIKTKSFKELNGYPIETLEDPAVRALKNSYESAYANYLAGFVYESLGEPSLAAPGYRKAAETRPNVPLIDDGLKNLDTRIAGRGKSNKVDTLIIVETGMAPAIQSVTLPIILPIPGRYGVNLIATPISWPVIRPDPTTFIPTSLGIDDLSSPVTLLTDVNVMARRALSDEMPGIITRSAVRAITRGITQAALDQGNSRNSGNAQLAGALVSLFVKVASVVTEVADERIWRTLPAAYSVTRVSLPPGSHKVTLSVPGGVQTAEFQIGGQYAVVALRSLGNTLYVAQGPVPEPSAVVVAPVAEPVASPVDPTAKPVKKKKSKAKKPATDPAAPALRT